RDEWLVRRKWPRVRVLMIESGQDTQRGASLGDRAREDADAVERSAGRNQPRRRDEPTCRLEPDDAVERGGHTAGSCGIGAERQRHQAERDGDCAAAAASARDVCRMTDRVAGAVGASGPDKSGGELIEV